MHTMHNTSQEGPRPTSGEPHYHAVAWIDHHEARVVHFNLHTFDKEVVRPSDPPHHLHIKAGSAPGTHVTAEPTFFRDVAEACGAAGAILLIGPSTAKGEFVAYLRKHLPHLADRIAEVCPSDKVTDNQLLAEGRRFFSQYDRMISQTA